MSPWPLNLCRERRRTPLGHKNYMWHSGYLSLSSQGVLRRPFSGQPGCGGTAGRTVTPHINPRRPMGSMWGEWLAYIQHMAKEDVFPPLSFFFMVLERRSGAGVSQGLVRAPRGLGVTRGAMRGRDGEGRVEARLVRIFCKPIFKWQCAWQQYQKRASGRLPVLPDIR